MGIVAGLLVVAGVVVYLSRPKEPEHAGRTLSSWIDQYRLYSQTHSVEALMKYRPKVVEAEKAIRSIGTNGIPVLLKKLKAPDAPYKTSLNNFLDRQSLIGFRFTEAQQERSRADYGFEVLGAAGAPAIPRLQELAASTNLQVRNTAVYILEEIRRKDAQGK